MRKVRVFLASPPGAARAAFRREVHEGWAPPLLAPPGVDHLAVCLVDATPETPPWQRPGEPPPAADAPAFDAVVDVQGGTAGAVVEALDQRARSAGVSGLALEVDEHLEKDAEPRVPGRATGGVKFLSLLEFHPDLGEAARRRTWAHHAPLALAVHVGMTRYVRDVVTAARHIGVAATHPRVHGVAELHFPDVATMTTRWFDSDTGRAAIVQDVGHFLLRATRLYATEHVLR
jgi:hypothetical protein